MRAIRYGFLRLFALGLLAGALTACGGGGSGFTGEPPEPDDAEVDPTLSAASLQLLSSSTQLPSAGNENVTLTAVIKDVNNVVVEGAEVSFAADNDGTLTVVRDTTDETGTAQATLSTQGNKDNRIITVTAQAADLSRTLPIQVTGTAIAVAGPSSVVIGETIDLVITLQDSAGSGISGRTLTVSSKAGNTITTPAPTGPTGQTTAKLTATAGGTDTITVSGANVSTTFSLQVSDDSFKFETPAPATEVVLGTAQSLTVVWLSGSPLTPEPGRTITFSATRGALSQTSVETDPEGKATVTVSSTTAGPAVITATNPEGTSTQVQLLFVATVADTMTLQAAPATIGTNPAGASGEQSTVTAVVLDPSKNPVKNQTVIFTLTDNTGGTISPASAVTDALGRASTVYTAGASASALGGVQIDATVSGASVIATTFLTVARQALFITLGTGNAIDEPDPTRYAKPYSVLVTDAAGGPVPNAQVSLSILPLAYDKGFYVFSEAVEAWVKSGGTDGQGEPPNDPRLSCVNEDANGDGFLDVPPDNDTNNNGSLEPGNVVTLSEGSVTTDSSGFAFFDLLYAQEFANWVQVALIAQATVAGTESVQISTFALEGSAADFTDQDVNPPGNPSPFGTAGFCADPT